MSLTDKLTMLMSRPGGDNAQKDDVPWWMRTAGRGLGTVGSFIAIIFGLFNCTGIILLQAGCLIAGIWQMLAGFIVLVCEAPCCFFIDYVQTLSDKVESRPYWQKAALYVGAGLRGALLLLLHRLRADAVRQGGVAPLLAESCVLCGAPCCCFFIDYVQTLSDKVESRPYWQKAALYVGLSLPPFFLCFLSVSTFLGSGLIFATGVVYGMMALGKKASIDDMRNSAATMEAGGAGLGGATTTAPRANLVSNEQPTSFTLPAKH
ncbi:hypothetical protein NE865_16556 [Phthorimaea operculella]|nr:hypothetical protein NE865_16556 [Phthorimaea operculella]